MTAQRIFSNRFTLLVFFIVQWCLLEGGSAADPDPPSNLSINVLNGTTVTLSWDHPRKESHTKFKLRLLPLSKSKHDQELGQPRKFLEEKSSLTLLDLVPGASYEIQLTAVYENKESATYISRNFTTKPNPPGRIILWYRNETFFLILWQPPYPTGIFTHYKVGIEPQDSSESVLYVSSREGEPPGPAQAAFNKLIPGHAYNISVQTVSEDQFSTPLTVRYFTMPLKPRNVTLGIDAVTP